MPYQTGEFPVYLDGQSVGSVTVFQNGLMTIFDSACDNKSSDVLRLAGVGGGRTAALGVMIPDKAGTLRLKKSFSKNALTNLGLPDSATFYLLRPGELGADAPPAPPIEPQTSPAADNQAADSNPPADNQAIASSGDNSGTVSPAAKENAASPAADNRLAAQAPRPAGPPDPRRAAYAAVHDAILQSAITGTGAAKQHTASAENARAAPGTSSGGCIQHPQCKYRDSGCRASRTGSNR